MSIYPNIYYVYFYLRSNDSNTAKAGTPYYVGKGKNRRMKKPHRKVPVPKDKSKIILVEQNLTELQAFILERYYIRWFGRKDLGTGILVNRTDGGDGVCGYIFSREMINQRNKKISIANSGKIRTDEHKQNMSMARRGEKKKAFTDEHKRNMSIAKQGNTYSKGRVVSEHSRLKSSNSNKNRLTVVNIHGNCTNLTKEEYKKQQIGDAISWEWVSVGGKIGKARLGKSTESIENAGKLTSKRCTGKVMCFNKEGIFVHINKETFHSQQGPHECWEWVSVNSKEGKRRKLNRFS